MEKLLINDIPLSELGAVLAPDSYKSVLTWAKFKSIQSNDWAEYNFAEYDLSKPTLDRRTVTLNFHANGANGYKRLMGYLLQYVYSFYEFPELGVTLRMRVDTNSLNHLGKWQSFSVTFYDDAPYFQVSPSLSEMHLANTGYTLDGVDLSRYGIAILKDTIKTLMQKQGVKERLTISENSMDGAIYDGKAYPTEADVIFKSGTFTLKCLIRAQNLVSVVRNYYYLYNLLRQSGTRRIYAEKLDETIECFYNQCTVNNVHKELASGFAGIAADISFTIVKRKIVTVLGTDNIDKALITHDNKFLIGD